MLGEALALGSALSWSLAVVLFRRVFDGRETPSPFALNLFKNSAAIVLVGATLLVTGDGIRTDRSTEDWLRLVASGVLGIAVSDLLFFHALRRLGAGRLTVVECAYAPSVALFGALFLDEVPSPGAGVGAVLVVAGMLVVGRRPPVPAGAESSRPKDSGAGGMLLGLGAMLTVALAIVVARPALANGGLAEVAFIRLVSGTAAQCLWMLADPSRREALGILRPQPMWRAMFPAAVLGSWVSMLLWVGGFKYADVATAAVLNQTTTVLTLLLARFMLNEPLTPARLAGVALGFSGALCAVLLRGG